MLIKSIGDILLMWSGKRDIFSLLGNAYDSNQLVAQQHQTAAADVKHQLQNALKVWPAGRYNFISTEGKNTTMFSSPKNKIIKIDSQVVCRQIIIDKTG